MGKIVDWVPENLYQEHLKSFPLLTVDAVLSVRRIDGILLIKRNKNNNLWKNDWATIGGRVFKGETLKQAISRKVKDEVGLKLPEDIFTEKGIVTIFISGKHYVTVVFTAHYGGSEKVKLDNTSSKYGFYPLDRLPPLRPAYHEIIRVANQTVNQ